MPINIQPSNGLLEPAEDMGFGPELKKNSSKRHSSSKTAKESFALPPPYRGPNDADKLKSKSGFAPPHSDLKQKATETVKRSATESDELVKYMSNLPGYLLRADRVESFQEKAFSVGVLDWSRLEKWKHKHIPVVASNFTSFNSSESSSRTAAKSSTSFGGKEKLDDKKGLLSSSIRPTSRESLPESTKLPFQNVKRSESSKSRARSFGDEHRVTPWAYESIGKTHSNVSLEKERKNDYQKRTSHVRNSASDLRQHGISYVPNDNANGRDDGGKQNMEGLQEYDYKNKDRSHKYSSNTGQPSLRSKNEGGSSSSKKMSSSSTETRKKVDHLKNVDFDTGSEHCHSQPSNVVLLYPQEIPQSCSSEDFRFSEFRTSSDENYAESSRSSMSYVSSMSHVSIPDEVHNEDGCSEMPLSSAQLSETMQHSISTTLGVRRSSSVSETHAPTINELSGLQSGAACFEKDVLDTKLRNQCVFSHVKESLDKEAAELATQKGINSSHHRRFSFSLSRLGRSFSFKEGPAIPQVSSRHVNARSSPVTPECSVRWDNSSKGKASIQSRTRASPLRRLLDPILKHKASHHSAESSQTQKESINSNSFRTITDNEPPLAEKNKGSSIQGLLQLTLKNGVPLFKFVLHNERKIFAATRNSLASPEMDDLGCCFTFYLVNEIKKKSGGWMSHGSKEKSCGYAYNMIAQMKFSSSRINEPINENSTRQLMVKEYVLLGIEIGQTDQGPPKCIQSAELAAVVIETPCENLSNRLHSDDNLLKKGYLGEERDLCSSGENDPSGSTIAILPGAVHGAPNKGEPTPLIYRWKTGGSCDCGGWDIGCKLLVLSKKNRSSNIPKSYKPYRDRFQLFAQEGDEQDTPLFTLLLLKDGFYSVEFNSAITLLQAFFISVVVLSSQKLPGYLEMGSSMHGEILKEPSSKNNSRVQGKAPVKYTPIPPLSPVGRV
ncbi:uncharacterized protein LOC130749457 [Lotus japonicus]|uniref:uncharacterized protein LOC130749457 n=1 Tax=Lotus japonicus TaxID=34305 RepID=UPI0025909813|nr:uncharacterized protein LOC130749457 [Lotus japonicus]XP_057458800.1 uncharacterized protein LOC130749457 [Lotus japonicus]XP_057458801.1 uncharacterized protein LOC130749457 [Lotus japonicus]